MARLNAVIIAGDEDQSSSGGRQEERWSLERVYFSLLPRSSSRLVALPSSPNRAAAPMSSPRVSNSEFFFLHFVFSVTVPLYVFFSVASLGDDPILDWILTEGKATQITRISPIGGGCINRASRYDTDSGSFFVKTNRCDNTVILILIFFSICIVDQYR